MMIGRFELHPACTLLPPLDQDEFRKLRDSIAQLGQLEPIAQWDRDGTVLDGRNRLLACIELGIEPRLETISPADPWDWVWARNMARRHIEAGRRAALRMEFDANIRAMLDQAAREAAARKTRGLRRGPAAAPASAEVPAGELFASEFHEVPYPREDSPVGEGLPSRDGAKTASILAAAAGCTTKTANKALKLFKERPDLHVEVCAGRSSLEKADRERRRGGTEEEWKKYEAYYTPEWPTELLVGTGFLPRPRFAIEPCVGGGSIVRALRGFCERWATMDIRDVDPAHDGLHFTGSWLEAARSLSRKELRQLAQADLLITNSAFQITQEVVEVAWDLCPNAQIWILQRRSWHDAPRADWFADHQPDEVNVSPRIRFEWPNGKPVGGGTDNTIHTWYGFSPGASQPCAGPNGGISRTVTRPGDPEAEAQ